MLTMETLKEFGADVDAGLTRCMGMKDFYLRLVQMELRDPSFAALDRAVEARDIRGAFEAAHALKGAVGNLSLTPLYMPICELTEMFRDAQTMPEATAAHVRVKQALDQLKMLAE